jgi:hypothetical protein
MKCLSLISLYYYLQNPRRLIEGSRIAAHLSSGCPVCNHNLQWLEGVTLSASEDRSFDFPEATIAAVVARFKEWTVTRTPIRQRIAQLVFDSLNLPQLADVRSGSVGMGARQMLYHADGYDIDLRFELSDETDEERLIGQVLPEHWDATELSQFKIQLLQDNAVVSATNTNAHGVFKIAQLASGVYDLKVSVPEAEINIEQVASARAM